MEAEAALLYERSTQDDARSRSLVSKSVQSLAMSVDEHLVGVGRRRDETDARWLAAQAGILSAKSACVRAGAVNSTYAWQHQRTCGRC